MPGELNIIQEFPTISLEQMQEVRFMNRMDTKFLINTFYISEFLERIFNSYYIQQIDGIRESHYRTLYFDNPGRDIFTIHQNGKANREKLRIRTYLDSDLSFFEIKSKNNKGRTNKDRIKIFDNQGIAGNDLYEFISLKSNLNYSSLVPFLKNDFYRMTFINRQKTERMTLDYDINFLCPQNNISRELKDIAVIEVKREGNSDSSAINILKDMRIHPGSFSKYCIGSILTGQTVKYNRFKKELIKIDKLTNYAYGYTC